MGDDQPKVWSARAATSAGAAAARTHPMAVLGRACGVRLPLRIVEGVICALRVSHRKQTARKQRTKQRAPQLTAGSVDAITCMASSRGLPDE